MLCYDDRLTTSAHHNTRTAARVGRGSVGIRFFFFQIEKPSSLDQQFLSV